MQFFIIVSLSNLCDFLWGNVRYNIFQSHPRRCAIGFIAAIHIQSLGIETSSDQWTNHRKIQGTNAIIYIYMNVHLGVIVEKFGGFGCVLHTFTCFGFISWSPDRNHWNIWIQHHPTYHPTIYWWHLMRTSPYNRMLRCPHAKKKSESIVVDRGTSQALTGRAPEPKIASGRVDGVGAMWVERQRRQNPQVTWPNPAISRDLWEDILAIPCANRDQVSSLFTSNSYNPVQNAIGSNVLLKHVPSSPDVAPHLQSSSSSSSSSPPVSTHVEWGNTINLYVLFA